MKNRLFLSALLFALILDAVIVQSQQLTVQIEAGKQVVLARADIEALPHIKVTTSNSPRLRRDYSLRSLLSYTRFSTPISKESALAIDATPQLPTT
jgi:hypothetical protein